VLQSNLAEFRGWRIFVQIKQRLFKCFIKQICLLFFTAFWNLRCITGISTTNHRWVINAQTGPVFLAHPVYITNLTDVVGKSVVESLHVFLLLVSAGLHLVHSGRCQRRVRSLGERGGSGITVSCGGRQRCGQRTVAARRSRAARALDDQAAAWSGGSGAGGDCLAQRHRGRRYVLVGRCHRRCDVSGSVQRRVYLGEILCVETRDVAPSSSSSSSGFVYQLIAPVAEPCEFYRPIDTSRWPLRCRIDRQRTCSLHTHTRSLCSRSRFSVTRWNWNQWRTAAASVFSYRQHAPSNIPRSVYCILISSAYYRVLMSTQPPALAGMENKW